MNRKSLGVVGAICLGLVSCELLGGHGSAPPSGPAAVRWWAERVEETPADYLAVYVEAAEVHLQQGTACIYVELRGGHNMLGKVGTEVRLPCPAPPEVLSRMREKSGTASPTGRLMTAEDCRGCTPQEAERVWNDAAERVARKPRGMPVPGAVAGPTSLVPAAGTGGRP
jgi:hypothetical protein